MRARFKLMFFGLLMVIISFIALIQSGTITSSVVSDKITFMPKAATFYFILIFILGIIAIFLVVMHRAIIDWLE